jgi:hypothetical protein
MDAYPGIVGFNTLTIALAAVDVDLPGYAPLFGGTPEYTIFTMIQQENAQGRVADVLGAARRRNPQHQGLKDLEAKWLRTVSADETTRLESMVVATLRYQPGDTWVERLLASYRWVCRVECEADGRSVGTGFLVEDDLVLTNYHVLFGRHPPGTPEPTRVRLRFDAVGSGDGRLVNVPTENWIVGMSPPGGTEWGSLGDPAADQLDFALLRLSEAIGNDTGGGKTVRGHAKLGQGGKASEPTIVLQHPKGANLQVCMGTFLGSNLAGTRLRHTSTTQRGSSGSPCLSMDLTVVGLHNGGVGIERNTAVPLSLIGAFLKKSGILITVD